MRAALATGSPASVEWQRVADVRYRGQSWSIPVESRAASTRRRSRSSSRASRTSTSASTARASSPARRSTSARSASPRSAPRARAFALPARRGDAARTRRADFGPGHGASRRRSLARLARRRPLAGPLLVDEYDTTASCRRAGRCARRRQHALVLEHVAVEADAAAAAHAEAIALRLVANALETVADEMATTIFRTAHSAVVRDAMDYSAALCAPTARRSRRR